MMSQCRFQRGEATQEVRKKNCFGGEEGGLFLNALRIIFIPLPSVVIDSYDLNEGAKVHTDELYYSKDNMVSFNPYVV